MGERDNGQADALMKGFSRATGDIRCWLDSDDLFEPWSRFDWSEHFNKHADHSSTYGDSSWIDGNRRFIEPKRNMGGIVCLALRSQLHTAAIDVLAGGSVSKGWRYGPKLQPGHGCGPMDKVRGLFVSPSRPSAMVKRARFYAEQRTTALRATSGQEGRRIRVPYRPPMSVRRRRAKRVVARALRVVLKAGAGGYSPREVIRHASTLVASATWESREADRQRQNS